MIKYLNIANHIRQNIQKLASVISFAYLSGTVLFNHFLILRHPCLDNSSLQIMNFSFYSHGSSYSFLHALHIQYFIIQRYHCRQWKPKSSIILQIVLKFTPQNGLDQSLFLIDQFLLFIELCFISHKEIEFCCNKSIFIAMTKQLYILYSIDQINIIDQTMFKEQIQKWRCQIRTTHIQTIKKESRDKILLLNQLRIMLADYPMCSLVSGDRELLNHQSYLDCQQFVVDAHDQMYRLIVGIGVQNCKQLLLKHHICKVLYELIDTIENKTLQLDYDKQAKHYLSKTKVISSIIEILCVFSQDIDLINQFNEVQTNKSIDLLFGQLKKDYPRIYTATRKWIRITAALINHFSYSKYEELVYESLMDGNFQLIMEFYCISCSKEESHSWNIQLLNNFIILQNLYLSYEQAHYTEKIIPKFHSNIMKQFIMDIVDHNIQILQDVQTEEDECIQSLLIDNILELFYYLPFNLTDTLILLKHKQFYWRRQFVELLSKWTFSSSLLKMSMFSEQQISQLLDIMKEKCLFENDKLFAKHLMASFFNLLINQLEIEKQIKRFRKCLELTQTVSLIVEHQLSEKDLEHLTSLLQIYHPCSL